MSRFCERVQPLSPLAILEGPCLPRTARRSTSNPTTSTTCGWASAFLVEDDGRVPNQLYISTQASETVTESTIASSTRRLTEELETPFSLLNDDREAGLKTSSRLHCCRLAHHGFREGCEEMSVTSQPGWDGGIAADGVRCSGSICSGGPSVSAPPTPAYSYPLPSVICKGSCNG